MHTTHVYMFCEERAVLMHNQSAMFYMKNKQFIETLHILHVIKMHLSYSSCFDSIGTWSVLC